MTSALLNFTLVWALLFGALPQNPGPAVTGATAGSSGGGGTLAFVQLKFYDSLGGGTGGSACNNAVNSSCTVTVSSVGAGHMLAAFVALANPETFTGVSGGESWTHCAGSNGCAFGSVAGGGYTDVWYVLSTTGGETSFTCNLSGTDSLYQGCGIMEFSYSGSSVSFDASNGNSNASACSSCAAPALSLTGTKDAIVQIGIPNNSMTAITSPYSTHAQFYSGVGMAIAVGLTSYTAPTWTQSGTAADVATMAIAFKGN